MLPTIGLLAILAVNPAPHAPDAGRTGGLIPVQAKPLAVDSAQLPDPAYSRFGRGFVLSTGKCLQLVGTEAKGKRKSDAEVKQLGRHLCRKQGTSHRNISVTNMVDHGKRMIVTIIKCG